MLKNDKPIPFVPAVEWVAHILNSLHQFLLAATECKYIRKSKRKPAPAKMPRSPSLDVGVYYPFCELEGTLNPRRLAFGESQRDGITVAGWPNPIRLGRLIRTLREGVAETLKDWGWEAICTSKAFTMSIAGIDGHGKVTGTWSSGTVELKMPRGWRPWVQQSIVEDLTIVRDAFAEYLAWHEAQQAPNEEAIIDELVTLAQVAPLTGYSKRTLERHLNDPAFPKPDVPGGCGKAHKWHWSTLRPALSRISRKTIPMQFPGGQII